MLARGIRESSGRCKPSFSLATDGARHSESVQPVASVRRAARRRTLSELLKLDDHQLRDIGVPRADVSALRQGRNMNGPAPAGNGKR